MYDSLRDTLDVHPAVRVEIHYDQDASDPRREFDHAAKMVLAHRRYDLPNESGIDIDDHGSLEETLEAIKADQDVVGWLPVYGYDHGSLTLRAGEPFSCPWDSGVAGLIYVTREAMDEGWNAGGWDQDNVTALLKSEVEEFDQYLTGQVYGFVVYDALTEENLESCWGFYGDESVEEEAKSTGTWEAERIVKDAEAQAHALNDALDVPDVAIALAATLVTA
jgi:hypothetical protein